MMKLIFYLLFLVPFVLKLNWWGLCSSLMLLSFLILTTYHSFNYISHVSYGVGIDVLSFTLILLTCWVIMLMIMASYGVFKLKLFVGHFMLVLLLMIVVLVLCFSATNLFLFYLYFEVSIIPTLFLVFGWGYQIERLSAGYYFLFYTLFASLPMLCCIFWLGEFNGTYFMYLVECDSNFYVYLSLVIAFLVSMPMFLFHFWLPKAHVEAPVSGSMVLAGILLKLGGYGLCRVLKIIGWFSVNYNIIFISISMIGMVYIGVMCLFQVDMKSMIAYSSISHMSLVICGIMTMNYFGMVGSLLLMVGHGLCSSGLFCLANIVYERTYSRSFYLNKGLISVMPSLSMFWFVFCANNMACPFSLNLFGELMLIISLLSWSFLSIIFLSLSSFLSCCCSIYLYSIVQHGSMSFGLIGFSSVNVREYYLLLLHFIPLNFLFLKVDIFSLWV